MITLFQRLLREDTAAHLLEYSPVVLGLSTVALEPYLFVNAFYRRADLTPLYVKTHIQAACVTS